MAVDRPTTEQGSGPDDIDAAVTSEWRKIEAERIAEEREEAREDLLDAEPAPKRWPGLALVAALIAGVALALALNTPSAVSRRTAAPPADGVPTAKPAAAVTAEPGPEGPAAGDSQAGPRPEDLEE